MHAHGWINFRSYGRIPYYRIFNFNDRPSFIAFAIMQAGRFQERGEDRNAQIENADGDFIFSFSTALLGVL
jgi:hypothetical protein